MLVCRRKDQMLSLITTLSRNYNRFFVNNIWSDEKANDYLEGISEIERRKNYLKSVYDIILSSDKVKVPVKLMITKTNGNKAEAASLYNRKYKDTEGFKKTNESNINSMVYYITTKVNELFMVRDNEGNAIMTPFDRVLKNDEISDSEWDELDNMIEDLSNSFYKSDFDKKIMVRLPAADLVRTCSDHKFNDFIDMITPYFMNQKGATEHKIKEYMPEVGYLRYLYSSYAKLSKKDKERKDRVDAMLSREDYIETSKQIDERADLVKELQKQVKDITKQINKIKTEIPENNCPNMTNDFLIHVGSLIMKSYYEHIKTGNWDSLKEQLRLIDKLVEEIGDDKVLKEYHDIPYSEDSTK